MSTPSIDKTSKL